MRRVPDIIIVIGVIVGATGIATGYRWVGGISLAVALFVGWKRDWCMESLEGMMGSSENSVANRGNNSEAAPEAGAGYSGDSGGGDAAGGDGD